jgi:hypothetical protein
MSASTPSDLAVAFRSFGRRLHDAAHDVPIDQLGPAGDLQRLVDRVALSLGVPRGRDVGATGAAIADAIAARPAHGWTAAELQSLQADALEAGRLLRIVEAATST